MARFTIIAILLAALMCLSGISASRGGARDLQASSKCVVYNSAKAVAVNQIVCESAYEDACAEHVKYFCRNPYAPVPDKVQAVAKARARAVAKAVADASVSISMDGWISAACLPGSYSAFEASARAKAMAQAVATSYVKAVAKVYGLNEFDSVYAKVTDSSKALARACETKYISICGPYHKCEKTKCTESRCGLECHYYDDAATTATAKAVAVAIARAEALVETYYNSEECKDDCKIRLCNYTCPEGCTPPTA